MKLTTRGKIVLSIALTLLVIGLVVLSSFVWWDGTDYCFGTAVKCLAGSL